MRAPTCSRTLFSRKPIYLKAFPIRRLPTLRIAPPLPRSLGLLQALSDLRLVGAGFRSYDPRSASSFLGHQHSHDMAMPSAESTTHPKPEVVGRAFVEQYYKVFHHSPELVHKFYMDSSVLSRPDSDGVMTSVTTLDAIDKLVLSLDSQNYFVELETIDSQTSFNDGVFILVTGCIKGISDGIRRKFSQSFFLAHQDKGAYFVLNDVFRYVNESQPSETEQAVVNVANGTNGYSVIPPLTSDQDTASIQEHHVEETTPPPEAVPENGNEVPKTTENVGSAVEDEIIMDQQALPNGNDASTVPEPTASVPREPATMKSYASIVKTKGSTATVSDFKSPTKDRQTTVTEKPSVVSVKTNIPSKPAAPPSEIPPASSNNIVESNNPHDVEGHSIYIKNLPLTATAAQVEEVFKKFGTIKPAGVQVRNHKIDRFCFGFVEFELLTSVQAAIEASPVTIGGRPVFVEEKKTTTRVINGVVSVGSGAVGTGRGRYPPGRVGFRNDNFRGRGGFGNNQSFGRGDFRNRGDYSNRGDYGNRGQYANRGGGRGHAGRSGEAYQQRAIQNGNVRLSRPNGVNQNTVPA